MKKIISIIVILSLSLIILGGCGNSQNDESVKAEKIHFNVSRTEILDSFKKIDFGTEVKYSTSTPTEDGNENIFVYTAQSMYSLINVTICEDLEGNVTSLDFTTKIMEWQGENAVDPMYAVLATLAIEKLNPDIDPKAVIEKYRLVEITDENISGVEGGLKIMALGTGGYKMLYIKPDENSKSE